MRQQRLRPAIDFNELRVNSVIACLYDDTGEWYLATIKEKNGDDFELKVHFFKPAGSQAELQGFRKSHKDDTAQVPLKNIIKVVETLENTTRRGRTYKMQVDEHTLIETLFSELMANGRL
jgi:hypothetical protein